MTRTTLAVAADYADALLVARRSKNVLFLMLLLVLLLQVAVFLMYRFDALHVVSKANPTSTPRAPRGGPQRGDGGRDGTATQPATAARLRRPCRPSRLRDHPGPVPLGAQRDQLSWASTLIIVLAVVLLLTSVIMLVGRLIGVSHVTSAFVWCVFLAVILFPWQSLLNSGGTRHPAATGLRAYPDADAGPATPRRR